MSKQFRIILTSDSKLPQYLQLQRFRSIILKMKTSMFVVILAAFSTTYVQATPLEDNSILERAADNLPGLNAVQTKHANQIIGEAKKANVGKQGCEAAITTGLTEVLLPCPLITTIRNI
jgi:DNA-binding transcriptional regulator/RsmH inhibitor MraZ